MEGLGINLGTLLLQILSFAILVIVLRKWMFQPMLKGMENRKLKMAQGLEDARVASEARANAEQEAAKIIAEAQNKANQLVRDATDRAEAAVKEVHLAAEADASKVREAARLDAQVERERILGDLRGQVAALSIAAAQKLVGEALDTQRQHQLLSEFFAGVKAGKVVVLEGTSLSGVSAEVTSALPLNPEELEEVKSDILSKMGNQATVTFRVDPEILGGLVIRVGGKVLDASVAGQLESLRQSLA